jgi:hypothetical protein
MNRRDIILAPAGHLPAVTQKNHGEKTLAKISSVPAEI